MAAKDRSRWEAANKGSVMLSMVSNSSPLSGYASELCYTPDTVWKMRYYVLQFPFLYVFKSSKPTETCRCCLYLRDAKLEIGAKVRGMFALRLLLRVPVRPGLDSTVAVIGFLDQHEIESWAGIIRTQLESSSNPNTPPLVPIDQPSENVVEEKIEPPLEVVQVPLEYSHKYPGLAKLTMHHFEFVAEVQNSWRSTEPRLLVISPEAVFVALDSGLVKKTAPIVKISSVVMCVETGLLCIGYPPKPEILIVTGQCDKIVTLLQRLAANKNMAIKVIQDTDHGIISSCQHLPFGTLPIAKEDLQAPTEHATEPAPEQSPVVSLVVPLLRPEPESELGVPPRRVRRGAISVAEGTEVEISAPVVVPELVQSIDKGTMTEPDEELVQLQHTTKALEEQIKELSIELHNVTTKLTTASLEHQQSLSMLETTLDNTEAALAAERAWIAKLEEQQAEEKKLTTELCSALSKKIDTQQHKAKKMRGRIDSTHLLCSRTESHCMEQHDLFTQATQHFQTTFAALEKVCKKAQITNLRLAKQSTHLQGTAIHKEYVCQALERGLMQHCEASPSTSTPKPNNPPVVESKTKEESAKHEHTIPFEAYERLLQQTQEEKHALHAQLHAWRNTATQAEVDIRRWKSETEEAWHAANLAETHRLQLQNQLETLRVELQDVCSIVDSLVGQQVVAARADLHRLANHIEHKISLAQRAFPH